MIKVDFHGWRLYDALDEIHHTVGKIRKQFKQDQAEFITGHGPIRSQAMLVLQGYGLQPEIDPGNSGVIRVMIE